MTHAKAKSPTTPDVQRGMALITAMLLLIVVTIMALSMFRSYGVEERLAGNTRDKQRAINAAVSAQQYAESWLAEWCRAGVRCVSRRFGALLHQRRGLHSASGSDRLYRSAVDYRRDLHPVHVQCDQRRQQSS